MTVSGLAASVARAAWLRSGEGSAGSGIGPLHSTYHKFFAVSPVARCRQASVTMRTFRQRQSNDRGRFGRREASPKSLRF